MFTTEKNRKSLNSVDGDRAVETELKQTEGQKRLSASTKVSSGDA